MLKQIKSNVENWVTKNNKRIRESQVVKKLTMCKKCYTFYYKNSWHFDKPISLEPIGEEEIPVKFVECPACLEQEVATYEMESNLILGRK